MNKENYVNSSENSDMSERVIIKTNYLEKKYRRNTAVKNFDLEIMANKITGIIGPNGAGKTTLLRMLAGYMAPTGGRVEVFGRDPFDDLSVAANLIFIDDRMPFPKAMKLGQLVSSLGLFYPNYQEDLARELMKYFNLSEDAYHDELSKGMKSSFNLIVGLAARVPLTIMDEPTTGMDAGVRKDFYRAIIKEYLAWPRTILLSSHLLQEIEEILEDVLLIKEGEKVLHLAVDEIKELTIGLRGDENLIEKVIAENLINETTNSTIYISSEEKSFTKKALVTEEKQVNRDSADDLTGPIIYRETYGSASAYYVVLLDQLSADFADQARGQGLEVLSVSTNDICVYLTARQRGGIDNVFQRA